MWMLSSRRISWFCGAWPIVNSFLYVCHFFFFFPFEGSRRGGNSTFVKPKLLARILEVVWGNNTMWTRTLVYIKVLKENVVPFWYNPRRNNDVRAGRRQIVVCSSRRTLVIYIKKLCREKGLKISRKAPGKYLHVTDKVLHSVRLATLWIFTMLHP